MAHLYRKTLGIVEDSAKPTGAVDIATAYFTVGGWKQLRAELEKYGHIRLLLGTEPDRDAALRADSQEPMALSTEQRKSLHRAQKEALERGRDILAFSHSSSLETQSFVQFLEERLADGSLEIRLYQDGFLHAKTLSIYGKHRVPQALLVTSANLTYSGLRRNEEAGTVITTPRKLQDSADWFQELWESSRDYGSQLLDMYKKRVSLFDPEQIWLRFGLAALSIAGQSETPNCLSTALRLYPFQRDGVARSLEIIDKHGGVLISDEVGLGKTFIAGEIAQRYVADGRRVLVVVPNALLKTWKKFRTNKLNMTEDDVMILSYTRLHELKERNPSRYSLIVLDEAHNVRNEGTNKRRLLEEFLQQAPNAPKVLLSATPVINGVGDLHNILRFFTDDQILSNAGVPSIAEKFREAKDAEPGSYEWDWLRTLLDRTAVRRTRVFVNEHYQSDSASEWRFPKVAPPRPVRYTMSDTEQTLVKDVMDSVENGYFYQQQIEHSNQTTLFLKLGPPVSPERMLTFASYHPSSYLKESSGVHKKRRHTEGNITGLMRSTLLNRLLSSPKAFSQTVSGMLERIESHLRVIDTAGSSLADLSGDSLKEWEEDISDDEREERQGDGNKDNLRGLADIQFCDIDRDQFQSDLENDKQLLTDWRQTADSLASNKSADPKVQAFVALLREIHSEVNTDSGTDADFGPPLRDRKKIIVFTSSKVTAEWLAQEFHSSFMETGSKPPSNVEHSEKGALAEALADPDAPDIGGCRPLRVTGSTEANLRERTLKAFAPKTFESDDNDTRNSTRDQSQSQTQLDKEFDILVATDVLSEGVNLQQAARVLHWDLPWTPSRIQQRLGRVDRLKSEHATVYNYVLMPEGDSIDQFLRVLSILQRKEKHSQAAFAHSSVIPGGIVHPVGQNEYIGSEETKALIGSLSRGEQWQSSGSELSDFTEDFRFLVRQGTPLGYSERDIRALPPGIGAVMHTHSESFAGWAFCVVKRTSNTDTQADIVFRTIEDDTDTISEDPWKMVALTDPRQQQALNPPVSQDEFLSAPQSQALFEQWAKCEADIVEGGGRVQDEAASGVVGDGGSLEVLAWCRIEPASGTSP